ncbi:MAG TPA: hypothetical protein VNE86_03365 [Nitrososphaerales archaeon]|nr:hypothetical protein [Nitrososphaerales archaeon]
MSVLSELDLKLTGDEIHFYENLEKGQEAECEDGEVLRLKLADKTKLEQALEMAMEVLNGGEQ